MIHSNDHLHPGFAAAAASVIAMAPTSGMSAFWDIASKILVAFVCGFAGLAGQAVWWYVKGLRSGKKKKEDDHER